MRRREQDFARFNQMTESKNSQNWRKMEKNVENFPGVLGTFRGLKLDLLNSLTEPLAMGCNPSSEGRPQDEVGNIKGVGRDERGST